MAHQNVDLDFREDGEDDARRFVVRSAIDQQPQSALTRNLGRDFKICTRYAVWS